MIPASKGYQKAIEKNITPKTHLVLKPRETSFTLNLFLSRPIVLKSCTEYGSGIAVLCAKFQNDFITEVDVTNKLNFPRFEYKRSLGGISYIATVLGVVTVPIIHHKQISNWNIAKPWHCPFLRDNSEILCRALLCAKYPKDMLTKTMNVCYGWKKITEILVKTDFGQIFYSVTCPRFHLFFLSR